MKKRSTIKNARCGVRLVDDVTFENARLITRLLEHEDIDQAWYYNGAVYGKTLSGVRMKFDMYDNISEKIRRKK